MIVTKLGKDRNGNITSKSVLITDGPNINGLLSFSVLDKDGKPMEYVSGTCRIFDIENGVNIWANYADKFLKSNCFE